MNARTAASGDVIAIRRYPVKSMQGEALASSPVGERGLAGDRGYAIQDLETGFIASAKHPRKWGLLLQCRAAFVEAPQRGRPLPPVRITLPDNTVISSEQDDRDRVLSDVLGRPVRLVASTRGPSQTFREADRSRPEDEAYQGELRQEPLAPAAPAGTFFDYAPVHLLTTSTLRALQALYPQGEFDPIRFRPNILIESGSQAGPFVETRWSGHRLAVGPQTELALIDPCPRCVVTTLSQNGLRDDREILRTLARHTSAASVTLAPGQIFRAIAGVYAVVTHAGQIGLGDRVCLR
jgi:uncharacterized protein